jgi:hypothetical protein
MTTNYDFSLQHKSEYLELSHEISKLRRNGDKVPKALLVNALTAGSLANVPDDELNALLFDLKNNN